MYATVTAAASWTARRGIPDSVPPASDSPPISNRARIQLLFPSFGVDDVSTPGVAASWSFRNSSNQHELLGSVSRVSGRHNMKLGAETRLFLINHMQASYNATW